MSVFQLARGFQCVEHLSNAFIDGHHAFVHLLYPRVIVLARFFRIGTLRISPLPDEHGQPLSVSIQAFVLCKYAGLSGQGPKMSAGTGAALPFKAPR